MRPVINSLRVPNHRPSAPDAAPAPIVIRSAGLPIAGFTFQDLAIKSANAHAEAVYVLAWNDVQLVVNGAVKDVVEVSLYISRS